MQKDYELLGVSATDSPATRQDQFRQRLDALMQTGLGNAFAALVDAAFVELAGREICVVSVRPSSQKVYLDYPERRQVGQDQKEFYIRRLSGSVTLTEYEENRYWKERPK